MEMGGNQIGLFIVIVFCILTYASSSSERKELDNENRHSTSRSVDIREKSVRNITLRGHGAAPYYNGVVLKGGSSGGGGGRGGGGGGGSSGGGGRGGGGGSSGGGRTGGGRSGKSPSKPGNRYRGIGGITGGTGGHKSSGGGGANDICKQSFSWISAMGLVLVTIFYLS